MRRVRFCFRYNGGNCARGIRAANGRFPAPFEYGKPVAVKQLPSVSTANPASDTFDAHVLPSQAPRACNGLAAVPLGGAYAAVPACFRKRKNVNATFDGGMWGLVRLPGTGCARREN
jgi:hypothetical protein